MKLPFSTIKQKTRGAALVEYGILVGLVSVLAISSVLSLGEEVSGVFTNVDETLEENMTLVTGGGTTGTDETGDTGIPSGPTSNPAWTELADYPTGGDCFDVRSDGTYDSGYECYNIDAADGQINNFIPEPGPLTFRVFGTGTGSNDGTDVMLDVNDGGSSTIVTTSAPTWFWHYPGGGTDYILFPDRNCSELTNDTTDTFGILSLDFNDGMRVITDGSIDGVYCGGDDTVLTNADLDPNGYGGRSMGGPGGF